MEQRTEELRSGLDNERLENHQLHQKLKEQESIILQSLESQTSQQNIEKAQSKFSDLEKDELLKSIDQLKSLDNRNKKKMTQL